MPHELIVVETLIRTCNRSPSQWEGKTADGRFLYVRYRWGLLEIGMGFTIDDAIDKSGNVFRKQLGGKLDGSMEFEELRQATTGLVAWPDTFDNCSFGPDPPSQA